MPIIPNNISDLYYNEKDLYLDVRLSTLTNEGKVSYDKDTGLINHAGVEDFTGYKTFNVGFFRESTGFGITNIKVETNTSLQPIVEIEFKDLYGKTVFGELNDNEIDGVNYASLFQWPPPKFVFTFKGYLGSPVTWLLNMKTTSTQYNSDDGSYTLKATFVPNQWGMFADLPFLYLYAAKKLRADRVNDFPKDSKQFIEATEGVIDLMYIGKTVEIQTKNINKEYDELVNKLEVLKRDPIQGVVSGIFSFGDVIKSTVGGKGAINGFEEITITSPGGVYDNEDKEDLNTYLKDLNGVSRNVENYKIKISSSGKNPSVTVDFGKTPSDSDLQTLKEESKELNEKIEKNLKLIDEAIRAGVYEEKKEELKKLTISEVFSTIAKDAAYIMGFIIDAGEQGYLNNYEARNKAESEDVIGRYFPMKFEKPSEDSKDLGKQVPVSNLGVNEFEKKFVSEFTTAISYGIAENKSLQAEANLDGDKKIKNIINNLEIGTENPFIDVTDWSVMASIIVKRAAILGFLTQSYNPSLPGNLEPDGDIFSWTGDYKKLDLEKVRSLADSDLNNINQSILNQLDVDGLQMLKNFCDVITAIIYDPDAEEEVLFDWQDLKQKIVVIQPGLDTLTDDETAKTAIKNIRKQIEEGVDDKSEYLFDADAPGINLIYDADKNVLNLNSDIGLQMKNANFIGYTVEEFMGNLIGPNKAFFGKTKAQTYYQQRTYGNGLDFETTLGTFVGMNGIIYTHVCLDENGFLYDSNGMEYVVFSSNEDVSRVSESLNAPSVQPRPESDEEGEEKEDTQTESDEVEGEIAQIVKLSSVLVKEDKKKPLTKENSKVSEFISFYNQTIKGERGNDLIYSFLDYNLVKNKDMKNPIGKSFNSSGFAWTKTFGPTDKEKLENSDGAAEDEFLNVNLNPVVIAPYAQYPSRTEVRCDIIPLAGGLFPYMQEVPVGTAKSSGAKISSKNDDEILYAQATLAFLRQFCKGLKPKIQKNQDEINKVFGSVLGKAGEHEDLIYQQMHTLFHQWQILGTNSNGSRINQVGDPSVLTPNVAEILQETYSQNLDGGKGTPINRERNDGSVAGGGFRYDYPLQAIGSSGERKVKVEDSIINIKPLYSAKANTTVLNIFQQLCTKNNFMFFPICGNARYDKITDIFTPQEMMGPKIGNFFQVMFQPTPESRTLVGNNPDKKQSSVKDLRNFQVQAFPIAFGDPTNKIVKNVQVGTDDNKVTAESIVNLQAIVDNENKNRTVTTDCSLLSVFEGRSYKAGVEIIGNAQISPMQFFFLENHTIFTGLYQIIKVSHKISPNNMTTDLNGIKMRYAGDSYGGVTPITLQDYEKASFSINSKRAKLEDSSQYTEEEKKAIYERYSSFTQDISSSQNNAGSSDASNQKVFGLDSGSKEVSAYLNHPTKKIRINKIINECIKKGIKSDYAIASVLAICSKESSFELKSEGFNYSAARLPEVWSYFKKNDPIKKGFVNPITLKADSNKYQEKIANIVYTQKPIGIREDGYGNTAQGDGWKYRGRGYNQITFKSGYEAATKYTGVDLVKNPERLGEEDVATSALVGFFNSRRTTKKFGPSSNRISRETAYGCTDDGITFPSLKEAVFFYYHLNAGPGYEVSHIVAKLNPDDKLGGMNRAQQRAPSFLEYLKENFQDKGITFS